MSRRTTRRQFVKTTAAIGAGFWVAGGVAPRRSLAANEEIRFACIGVGGKGSEDSSEVGKLGKVVAICDIDEEFLNKKGQEFPDAKKYTDFRKMLEEMGDSIDAVTVSTPDHTHAVAALMAMRMGKHCYCQKPMTHSIEEARLMAETAAKSPGLVTQMGNQGTALATLRKSAAAIRAGAVGNVSEVHVWTNRPVWPQGLGLKPKTGDAPSTIHWDLWLGPTAKHAFSNEIHPFKWRGYWAFGTGALGDMACHTLNMSYMALDLNNPVSVKADALEHDKYVFPGSSVIEYEFAANDWRPALKMFWYDGGERPLALLKGCPKDNEGKHFTSGALVIGEKGKFYSPGDYSEMDKQTGVIHDDKEFVQLLDLGLELDVPKSPGHYAEFANAIRGEGKPMSNFADYAGGLTETVLLGNLAVWARGHKVAWDRAAMACKATKVDDACPDCSQDELDQIVRHEYRNGFTIHTI